MARRACYIERSINDWAGTTDRYYIAAAQLWRYKHDFYCWSTRASLSIITVHCSWTTKGGSL